MQLPNLPPVPQNWAPIFLAERPSCGPPAVPARQGEAADDPLGRVLHPQFLRRVVFYPVSWGPAPCLDLVTCLLLFCCFMVFFLRSWHTAALLSCLVLVHWHPNVLGGLGADWASRGAPGAAPPGSGSPRGRWLPAGHSSGWLSGSLSARGSILPRRILPRGAGLLAADCPGNSALRGA